MQKTGIWGKIIGALLGLSIGKLPGLLIGLFIGHQFDGAYARQMNGGFAGFGQNRTSSAEQQAAFFHACFAVMGHAAKAKGRVTKEEIRDASAIMDRMGLQGESRLQAQNAFREGKEDNFPVRRDTKPSAKLRVQAIVIHYSFFLELQIPSCILLMALIHRKERQLLHIIARYLGFSGSAT